MSDNRKGQQIIPTALYTRGTEYTANESKTGPGAEVRRDAGNAPGGGAVHNNLGHRGLDWLRARGTDGLPRAVALSVVAPNLHRIGLLLRKRTWRRCGRAATIALLIKACRRR